MKIREIFRHWDFVLILCNHVNNPQFVFALFKYKQIQISHQDGIFCTRVDYWLHCLIKLFQANFTITCQMLQVFLTICQNSFFYLDLQFKKNSTTNHQLYCY